jgi:PEP-CTERM motif
VKTLIPVFVFIALSGVSSLNAASISYLFEVDTTTLDGQPDNLDFQLNPGDLSSAPVTLDISGFVVNGGSFAASQIVLTPDATGSLAGDLRLDNGSGFNDAFQPVNLGTSVEFLATFSGAGVDNPASPGSSFGFSIYDNAGTTPLLTTSLDGTIAGVNLDASGVNTFTNSATPGGGSNAVVSVFSPVPEPSTWVGMSLGMGLCLIALRVRRTSN